jgi:hypothetical protein
LRLTVAGLVDKLARTDTEPLEVGLEVRQRRRSGPSSREREALAPGASIARCRRSLSGSRLRSMPDTTEQLSGRATEEAPSSSVSFGVYGVCLSLHTVWEHTDE